MYSLYEISMCVYFYTQIESKIVFAFPGTVADRTYENAPRYLINRLLLLLLQCFQR